MPIPEQFGPNPKLRLQQPWHEVARFKHLSLRTEHTYWDWTRRYILFHGKRHPRDMGAAEAQSPVARSGFGQRQARRGPRWGWELGLRLRSRVGVGLRGRMGFMVSLVSRLADNTGYPTIRMTVVYAFHDPCFVFRPGGSVGEARLFSIAAARSQACGKPDPLLRRISSKCRSQAECGAE